MTIRILPPDPAWPQAFATVAARLRPLLPAGAVLHHIGSTAVPGLQAKPIIDIQVTIPALAIFDPAPLLAAGFERRAPICDHAPPGMTLPEAELAKRLFRSTTPDANIHIREAGRFNQRYPLLCRDYLRSHPGAAAAYGVIKEELAARFPKDVEAYYAIKDPVFDLIMAGAEEWAKITRWALPPGD